MKLSECKKEWNQKDFSKVNRALKAYFSDKSFLNHKGEKVNFPYLASISQIENILGLPYTSTSQCAMLAMDCNTNLTYPENTDFHYSYVVMTNENKVVLILQDREENEIFITI